MDPCRLSQFLCTDLLHCSFKWQVHPLPTNLNRLVLKIFSRLRVTKIQLSKWEEEKQFFTTLPEQINFCGCVCQSNTQTFVTSSSVAYKLLGTVVASIRNKEGCLGKTLPDLHRYLLPYDPFSCTVQSGRVPPVPSAWQSFLPQYATRQKTFFFLKMSCQWYKCTVPGS